MEWLMLVLRRPCRDDHQNVNRGQHSSVLSVVGQCRQPGLCAVPIFYGSYTCQRAIEQMACVVQRSSYWYDQADRTPRFPGNRKSPPSLEIATTAGPPATALACAGPSRSKPTYSRTISAVASRIDLASYSPLSSIHSNNVVNGRPKIE